MPKIKAGQKYGRLTTIKKGALIKTNRRWLCKCDCGNEKEIHASCLHKGTTRSCGCLHSEEITKRNSTHRLSKTATYSVWLGVKDRCLNKKSHDYKDYGLRGILVCDSWLNFENFYKDMGEKPNGKSLDRIDNSKGYFKENCRWATHEQQANNKRTNAKYELKGKIKTLSEWSKISKIPYHTLKARLNRLGWDINKAISTPVRKHTKSINQQNAH